MEMFLDIITKLVMAALILVIGYVGGNWAYKTIQTIKKLDGTLRSFLGGLAKYAIFALAIVTVLQQFGFQTASLLAVLGAAGLAIGLALQGTLSNVSAGVMLLILRPFNVGDTITSAGITGTVKSLGLFATEMATPDNIYIFVPNSKLWNTDIQNFSKNNTRRQDIVVGISYKDDIEKAFKTIEAVAKKDKRITAEGDKAPQIMVTDLGDSSVNITLRIWSKSTDFWSLKVDTTKAVKEALDKAEISIPFPTRTLEMCEPASEKTTKKKAA